MAPIHEAARTSDVEGIRLALFEDKVPPDLLTDDAEHHYFIRFAAGLTPLLIVCNHAKPDVPGLPLASSATCVRELLAAGASVHVRAESDENSTPLIYAADNGVAQIVKMILDAGAPVDAVDDKGRSALHWAARFGHVACVAMLLKAGAEVDRKSPAIEHLHSTTPLDYAVREFRHRVYALLLRAGAALPTAYHENLGGFAEHKLLGGPYFVRIAEAGGFPAYERLQRGKLIATATKMLGHRLPPSIIPTVVKFWGHPGEYASRGHDPWNPGPVFY